MSYYATKRQAFGRYYDMIIILMLFVMLYCIYRTGEVQHASLKASIWSKTEEALKNLVNVENMQAEIFKYISGLHPQALVVMSLFI